MARPILACPNWLTPDPRFATVRGWGGRWEPGRQLQNLCDPFLSSARAAVSVDTTPGSTCGWLDLGRLRDTMVVSLPFLSAYRDGLEVDAPSTTRVRWRCFDAPDLGAGLIADSGWEDLFSVVYPAGSLPAEHPAFVDGRLPDEDAALFPMPFFHVFPERVVGRHWFCEIDLGCGGYDALVLPHAYLAPGWQPPINFNIGAAESFEDPSPSETSLAGEDIFEDQPGRRVVRFSFDELPEEEALVWIGDMQRRLKRSRRLLFIWNPVDRVHRHRRAMLCRQRQLPPREAAAGGRTKATFELIEVLP
jgi:hypothetical protein